jgi:WD40 repeat protein
VPCFQLHSASEDQTVKVWGAASGQEVLTLKGHSAAVEGVAFSPDGKRLGSASRDRTVKLWDATTGQEILA